MCVLSSFIQIPHLAVGGVNPRGFPAGSVALPLPEEGPSAWTLQGPVSLLFVSGSRLPTPTLRFLGAVLSVKLRTVACPVLSWTDRHRQFHFVIKAKWDKHHWVICPSVLGGGFLGGEQTVTRGEGNPAVDQPGRVCPQTSRRTGVSYTTCDSRRGNCLLYSCRLQMTQRMSKDIKQGRRSPGETCFLLWHKAFLRS